MSLKNMVFCSILAFVITGCEGTETTTRPASNNSSATVAKTVVGGGGMASFSAPENCENLSPGELRKGGATQVRTGCVVSAEDSMVIVGLTEIEIPFEQAFSAPIGSLDDLQMVSAAFPREMLSEYVVKSEQSALSSAEPGWRYSNKKSKLLPGDGGVDGASACVQFSFDGVSTSGASDRSRNSGLRCARFGQSLGTIQEVLIEIMAFYPVNQKVSPSYRSTVDLAKSSLRYR